MNEFGPLPAQREGNSKARTRLWLRLLRVSRAIEWELRERLRVESGTTLPRFDVLAALSRHPNGLRMSELSSVLHVSNGNVTGIVERLAADGLILRIPVESDRRATVVSLTEAGRDEFFRLADLHERWVNDLLSAIDSDEAETLWNLLAQLPAAKGGLPATPCSAEPRYNAIR